MNGLCSPWTPSCAVLLGSVAKAIRVPRASSPWIGLRPRGPIAAGVLVAGELVHERIVSARVEKYDIDAFLELHLLEHHRQADRADVQIRRALQVDVDRKQEILVVNRNAAAGIINDRRFRLRQRRGEIRHRLPHLGDVEVVTIDDLKAQLPESFRYGPGVVSGVVEVWGDLIVSVADHERYTLFGIGVRGTRSREHGGAYREPGGEARTNRQGIKAVSKSAHLPLP